MHLKWAKTIHSLNCDSVSVHYETADLIRDRPLHLVLQSELQIQITMYSKHPLIGPLSPEVTYLMRPDFRCTEIVIKILVNCPPQVSPLITSNKITYYLLIAKEVAL